MFLQWFWQPDLEYVNKVNTTNLRSIRGIQLAALMVAFGLTFCTYALLHAIPWHPDPCPDEPCLEPLARVRAGDIATTIFGDTLIFVELLVGIAVGGAIGKRLTDTEHKVDVELAKQGLTRAPDDGLPTPTTKEHPAPARRQSRIMVRPAEEPKAANEPDNRTDDESGS